jgi:hypothetical protein
MIRKFIHNIALMLVAVACFVPKANAQSQDTTINVPLGGNAWVRPNGQAQITNDGLVKWSSAKDTVNIYVGFDVIDKVDVALKLHIPQGESKIMVRVAGNSWTKTIPSTSEFQVVNLGRINARVQGYTKFEIIGLTKTGNVFADIADLVLTGATVIKQTAYVHDNHGNYFHWGRRGPSVHLNYKVPDKPIEWFYNEVTVPVGKDIIGSYFMADGFSGGYFGMQVNSATERRLLFSVWSPYQTNDPKSIPDNMKIQLLKKGETVHAGAFGGEGSGGQSYALYPWVAGKTYCFLLHAQGDIAAETTIYTAYFKPKDAKDWQLIASFKRPQSGSYLKGLHSFLENFNPEYGDKTREVHFSNQWTRDIDGGWVPVSEAKFTGDATAKINYRKDHAGGTRMGQFYLRNGGFFNDLTQLNAPLTVNTNGRKPPEINFDKLP